MPEMNLFGSQLRTRQIQLEMISIQLTRKWM